MRKWSASILFAAATMTIIPAWSQAALNVYYDIDFDSEPLGAVTSSTAGGYYSTTTKTKIGNINSNFYSRMSIVNGFTDPATGESMSSNVLVFDKTSGMTGQSSMWFLHNGSAPDRHSGSVTISYDLMLATSAGDNPYINYSTGNGTNGTQDALSQSKVNPVPGTLARVYLRGGIKANGDNFNDALDETKARVALATTSGQTGVSATLDIGRVYHYTWNMDIDANLMTLNVKDSAGNTIANLNRIYDPTNSVDRRYAGWQFDELGSKNNGVWVVDNIVVAIPEPASLGLIGLGGLTIFRRRRKQ